MTGSAIAPLGGRAVSPAGPASAPGGAPVSGGSIATADFDSDYAVELATRIINTCPSPQRQELTIGFDRLPAAIRDAITIEISNPPIGNGIPASNAELIDFIQTEAGRAAVSYWGRRAPENVGIVLTRFGRVLASLSDDDGLRALDWFDQLPASVQVAVFIELAR